MNKPLETGSFYFNQYLHVKFAVRPKSKTGV